MEKWRETLCYSSRVRRLPSGSIAVLKGKIFPYGNITDLKEKVIWHSKARVTKSHFTTNLTQVFFWGGKRYKRVPWVRREASKNWGFLSGGIFRVGISRLRIGEISSPELCVLGSGIGGISCSQIDGFWCPGIGGFYPFSNLEVHSDILPYNLLVNPCPHNSVLP